MKSKICLAIGLFAAFLFARTVVIQYSTYLTDLNGKVRNDIVGRTIYFRLFNAQTNGSQIWSESHTVTAKAGFVSVMLGSVSSIPLHAIDTVPELWLEMEVAAEPAYQRQRIASNFYCLTANFADTAAFAHSATIAVQCSSANVARRADTLGNQPANKYVLLSQLPSAAVAKADSASTAKNADSLGKTPANQYVKVVQNGAITVDSITNTKSISSQKMYADSIQLQSTGSWLRNYVEGTFQCSLFDGSTYKVSGTAKYLIIGNLVTMYFPPLQAENISVGIQLCGFPLSIRPPKNNYLFYIPILYYADSYQHVGKLFAKNEGLWELVAEGDTNARVTGRWAGLGDSFNFGRTSVTYYKE